MTVRCRHGRGNARGRHLADNQRLPPHDLTTYNGRLFFSGHDTSGQDDLGRELWTYSPLATDAEPAGVPGSAMLSSAYPNPASSVATFTLTLSEAQQVRVSTYDLLGREVAVLHDGPLSAGAEQTFVLDTAQLSTGVYLVRAVGDTFAEVQRVTVVR